MAALAAASSGAETRGGEAAGGGKAAGGLGAWATTTGPEGGVAGSTVGSTVGAEGGLGAAAPVAVGGLRPGTGKFSVPSDDQG